MRSTVALSMVSLLLSPTLVSAAPVTSPKLDAPSAYTGAAGQAPGGNAFGPSSQGLGFLAGAGSIFSHNAGDGGIAKSGNAHASGNAYSGAGGAAPGGSTGLAGAGPISGDSKFANLLHLGSDNAGKGGDASSGDAYAGVISDASTCHLRGGCDAKGDHSTDPADDSHQPTSPNSSPPLIDGTPGPARPPDGDLPPQGAPANLDDGNDNEANTDSGSNANCDECHSDQYSDSAPEPQNASNTATNGDESLADPGHTKNIVPPPHDDGALGQPPNNIPDNGDIANPGGVKAVQPGADVNEQHKLPTSNSYSGAGGTAPGGSVAGSSGLINIFSGNAGDGGKASSGQAGTLANGNNGGNSYSGAGGQAAGGSITKAGGLINIFSNNAGDGGGANSGHALRRNSYTGAGGHAGGGLSSECLDGLIDILACNAGRGGVANSGDAYRRDSYTGAGGQALGGSVSKSGGLINLISGNAGDGGSAESGDALGSNSAQHSTSPNAYSGAGGQASGGSILGTDHDPSQLDSILSNVAGDGDNIHLGSAFRRDSFTGVGGQVPGGSVAGSGGLVNIASNNAGDGGLANSGDANSGDTGLGYSGAGGHGPGGSTSNPSTGSSDLNLLEFIGGVLRRDTHTLNSEDQIYARPYDVVSLDGFAS